MARDPLTTRSKTAMPAESLVYRDWAAGMDGEMMAEKYGVDPDTVRHYIRPRLPRWKTSPPPQLRTDQRRLVIQKECWQDKALRNVLISLPHISMYAAVLEERANG